MTFDEAIVIKNPSAYGDSDDQSVGPNAPSIEEEIESGDQQALMESLEKVVENTTRSDGAIADTGIHAPSSNVKRHTWYRKRLTGWLHSHLVPPGFKSAVKKKFGNFVIIRSTGELHYEEMPIYTRIGMHLLFGGYYRGKVDDSNVMQALFQKETLRQGLYFTQPESVSQIPSFVQHYTIDMSNYVISDIKEYKNFNEFFTRAILPSVRPIAEPDNHTVLVSAADSRLSVFESVDEATTFWVKGKQFTLGNLLQNDTLAKALDGGSIAIFRLAPQDYHRYHIPIRGKVESITPIAGTYYTVNPCTINNDLNVFTENHRSVIQCKSPHDFPFAIVSIGALLVGSIVHTHAEVGSSLEKGEEMGYFQYGGSTVIAVFPKNTVTWDQDLLTNSRNSLETVVLMGERIGEFTL